MNIINKFKRISDYEVKIEILNQSMVEACAKIRELEEKLDTSRKLYSIEHDRADNAVEGAALMADQNAFLRDAMMRMIEKGKAGAADAG